MTDLTRRDAILAAVAAAIAAGVPSAGRATGEVTVAEFLALSERLTGATGLDQGVAQTLLGGFLATGHGPGLGALAAGDAPRTPAPLADAIVAAWYSGLYDTGSGPAVADFDGRAALERARLHQAVRRLRRRDRLLGRSARDLTERAWPTTSAPTSIIVGSGIAGALARGEARRRRREGRDPRGRAPRSTGRRRCRPTGTPSIKVPECPYPPAPQAMHPVSQRSRLLVRAGRAGQVRQHLPQGRRRHHLALARHLPALRAERLPAADASTARASTGRSPTTSSSRSTARPSTRSACRATPPTTSARRARRPTRCRRSRRPSSTRPSPRRWRARPTRCAPTPQGRNSQDRARPAGLLRQRQLHPGLPDPGQVRRDRAPRPRRPPPARRCTRRRRRSSSRSAPTGGSRRSASSAGTAARAGRRARSSSSPRTPSRRRACCSTRAREATPRGVANSSDQVGRNLMDHPTQLSWALADEPVYPYRGPLSTSGHREPARRRLPQASAAPSASRSATTAGRGRPARRSARPPSSRCRACAAAALDKALRDQASRHIRLASLVEQPPDPENRVTLGTRPRHLRRAGAAARLPARRLHQGRLRRRGRRRTTRSSPSSARPASSTARTRKAPATSSAPRAWATTRRRSVVDRELRSHDHPNLFIARLGGLPDLRDRQPDAHHRRPVAAGGRGGEANAGELNRSCVKARRQWRRRFGAARAAGMRRQGCAAPAGGRPPPPRRGPAASGRRSRRPLAWRRMKMSFRHLDALCERPPGAGGTCHSRGA